MVFSVRRMSVALLSAGVGVLVAASVYAQLPRTPRVGTLRGVATDRVDVTVPHLRNDHGIVRCILYDSPEGFPNVGPHAVAIAVASPGGTTTARCKFVGVLPRNHDFAVSIHHDENADGVMQTGAFGIPQEGYGFSNNIHPVLSAPSFQDCHFHFNGGLMNISIDPLY